MPDILGKLKIIAFATPKFVLGGPPVGLYIAMFNPETFSVASRVAYDRTPVPGSIGTELKFRNIETQTYNFEFLIDGTGASGEKRDVFAEILLFKYTVGYYGEIHRPHYLILNWGTFIANCVLQSMNIKYELFNSSGIPLRARIQATFLEHVESRLESLLANRSSPDLIHERIVKEGDTLPLLSYQVYGDSSYYLEIARINHLDDFRNLRVGDRLIFPPIDKTVKQT